VSIDRLRAGQNSEPTQQANSLPNPFKLKFLDSL
jgi:hypothetical protein